LEQGETLLGALLINQEGGFDNALAEAIYRGERRPRGHLLAQTLSFHGGCRQAASLEYARVMRIAVHPERQGHGLGSHLLAQVVELERQQPVAAIGTSFGASSELLRFWQRAGFELVRMGFTRDHASGSHSAVMLKPLNRAGESVFRDVRQRFRQALACWLAGPLADVPTDISDLLSHQALTDFTPLSKVERGELVVFADSHRGVEACLCPLLKLARENADLIAKLKEEERQVIISRLIQNQSWSQVVVDCGVAGKSQAVALLRRAIGRLLLLSES
jgi:tRNA(Met) cytidine acetyltransferase